MTVDYCMYRGDNLLHIGTIKEIAELHGVKEDTVKFYTMPTYLRRRANSKTGNFITVIKLEEEEE